MKRIIPIYQPETLTNVALPSVEMVDSSAMANLAKLSGTELSRASALLSSAQDVVSTEELSTEEKYQALLTITGRVSDVLNKVTPCKSGCSSCCKMAVGISGWEADRIGKYLNIEPVNMEPITTPDMLEVFEAEHKAQMESLIGVPCPFLVNDRCSIYEVRPLPCRTHYNLSSYPEICDTTMSTMDVPNFNFSTMWQAWTYLGMDRAVFGDIRMFFPDPFGGVEL